MKNVYTIKSIDGQLSFDEYKELVQSFFKTLGLTEEELVNTEEKGAKK